MLRAPGMCPARCAVSVMPGGAMMSPTNSAGERTSTSATFLFLSARSTSGRLARSVAAHGIVELRLPVPTDCARDVARVVSSRVDVDLDEADAGVVEVCGHPVGGDEHFRMSVAHGSLQASNTRQPVSGMGPKKTVGTPGLVHGQR